ncbi:dynein axonemal assembly factor 10 [Bacillus rossius redtenbacheri]|uniref:dynein axonemal assembly factor 10 n=1 Tax=Bacillus rossius redtenbacheri TaxID=93214 RepID=UPI002FDCC4FC
MEKPQIICHADKSTNFSIFDTRWIPCSPKFVVLGSMPNGTGIIQLYEISEGGITVIKEVQKSKSFKCGSFGASSLRDRQLATGDFEGNLNIWNVEDLSTPVYSAGAHKEIINSIDGVGGCSLGCGAPEIVTGSRDGSVKVWDPRQKGRPVATMEPAEGSERRDCWAVTFGNSYNSEERVVCAGYDNGDIKLFDLRTMMLRWEKNVKNGVCGLEFDRKDIKMNKLLVTTLESKLHVFDMRTQHPKKGFASVTEKAHSSTVWAGRHLPQNRDLFVTCGGAGSICLWKYCYPSKRTREEADGTEAGVAGSLEMLQNMSLTSQPVCGFDWSPDKLGLAVCCSLDQTVRVLVVTRLARFS